MAKKDKKDKKDLGKKSKKKKESKKIQNKDNVSDNIGLNVPNDTINPKMVSFNSPEMINLPPFLRSIVNEIQKDTGVQFNTVNIRMVGLDEIDDLPTDLLQHILKNAVSDENYELASIVRDAIKNKKDGE
jgi:hypothetical protein